MEVFIFGWWWTSHQSLAHKGLRILRFCIVPWKDEREPTIKLCMGRQIDVVQKFTRIQSFGQNWWWANEIRVEYVPRIHHIAALPQSPRVIVWIECNTRKIHRTDGQGYGVPKAGPKQASADSRGSRTCVCANTYRWGWHRRGEGWIDILPWYRPVGVAKTSSETQRRKSRAAQKKGKWPPRGTGTIVLTYPGSAPR